MPNRRPYRGSDPQPWASIANLVIFPLVAGAVYAGIMVFNAGDKLATKPYVDENILGVRKYTDEKSLQTLKDAYDHSDANRQTTMLEISRINAENREALAKVTTTLELLLHTVQNLRPEDGWNSTNRKKVAH